MSYAKEQGILQGIGQGIENGKVEVIKNMLLENMDYSIISKVIGKSIKEIEKIGNNI